VGLKGSRVQAVVSELGGERIDIVPWHPEPEVFARRALAPARVSRVVSDATRQVITAIVDEDQLSLAIGRNGQNVRLASQLIGWQIDLYGSREWLEKGQEFPLFGDREEEQYETADFPLAELEIAPSALAALEVAGYNTFLDIIDLERADFLRTEGITEGDADRLVELIDQLTVVEEPDASDLVAEGGDAEAEADDEADHEADEAETDAPVAEADEADEAEVAEAVEAAHDDETQDDEPGERED
jgi:N utilization substance protein A